MKWNCKWFLPILGGIVWATVPALAAWALISYSAELASTLAGSLGLEESLVQQIVQVLAQLKQGVIAPPWGLALLVGSASGVLFRLLCTSRGRRIAAFILAALLLVPLTAGALLLTRINEVQLAALLKSFLPMLEGLI